MKSAATVGLIRLVSQVSLSEKRELLVVGLRK